jgi:integrase
MQYRDMLERKTYARSTAQEYLDGIHRLFAIAYSEGVVQSNPVTGVKLRTARNKFIELQRRRPFEANEIRLLFEKLKNETEPFQWLVRLLVFHGMRSGEAAQLRVEDITTISNVKVIRVHDRYGSVKNRNSQRDIPLHPKCAEFINYAQAVSKNWIFPQRTLRSDRFQSHAGYFLRRRVGITDRALTMHSLRHTWRTLAREICMPPAVSRAIMGHSMGGDVHDEYGGRPSLRLMSEWMNKIEFDLP